MNVTSGRLNLGSVFSNTSLLPAPSSVGGSTVPDLWDIRDTAPAYCVQEFLPGPTPNPNYPCEPNPPSATIRGTQEGSAISIPVNNFRFPVMFVTADQTLAPLTLVATEALEGTLQNERMQLEGDLEARIPLFLAPSSPEYLIPPLHSYCSVPLPDFQLTSGTSFPASVGFQGTDFAGSNPESPGALTGTWTITGPLQRNGNTVYDAGRGMEDQCAFADNAIQGPGGIWLGAGVAEPEPYPTCSEEQTGIYPDCIDPPIPPSPLPFKIDRIQVKPTKKIIRAGQRTLVRIRIQNSGQVGGSASVSLQLSNKKGFRLSAQKINFLVPAGASRTETAVLLTQKKARGKSTVIVAKAEGVQGKARLRVR